MSSGFNLKSLAVLAPNKRVSLSFEALKPGTDFSSLAMKVLDSIFFQQKEGCFVCIANLLFRIATFVNYLSKVFWIACCSFYISTRCFTL